MTQPRPLEPDVESARGALLNTMPPFAFFKVYFALLTVYFWDVGGGSLQPGKQRKVYFIDPLLASLPARLVPGSGTPPVDGVVENLVGLGLFRSASQSLIQAAPVPGSVAY